MFGAAAGAMVNPAVALTAPVIPRSIRFLINHPNNTFGAGLTQYSVCKALDKKIPRVAQDQYHSSLGKHLPRANAQEGDMLFWATNGDCANRVAHVGIFIREGLMINAAHTGTPVREQKIWISSGGEKICDDAVR